MLLHWFSFPVYQIKQSDTSNIVVMSSWKDSALIRVCYEENGESICKEAGVNNTVDLDMKISKFTIFIGNTSLISDKFKGIFLFNPASAKTQMTTFMFAKF